MRGLAQLPDSLLQMLAIFMSIIIEALPFVFLGAILSGFIDVFVTPDKVRHYLPKGKWSRIIFGTLVGTVFPSCECGIVPIVNRFISKKVPSYTAIPFLVTAPIINPIVLFATFSAFGNSWRFVLLRFLGASLVAITLGVLLGFVWDENITKLGSKTTHTHDYGQFKTSRKTFFALAHAIDEFFDTGRYLIFGSLVAASMQIYVPTRLLTTIGHNPVMAIAIMMLLAFLLSLCSEADAFIGASLLSTFGLTPIMAFLLFGPMIDIKNLLMMRHVFKGRFIVQFILVVTLVIFLYCLGLGVMI